MAALNNELIHTGAVYRVDGSIHAWPPPRMGTAPDFRTLAWFTPMPRRGDLSFVRLDPLRGGEVDVVVDDRERIRLARWGNYPGEVAPGDAPTRTSAMRLERYRVLSGAFLTLRDQEVEVARRRLAEGAVLECRQGGGSRTRLVQALAPVRQRARWDLYTHLDLPLQLALAADAATDLGERDLAAARLAEAEATRPGLELVANLRAGLGRPGSPPF